MSDDLRLDPRQLPLPLAVEVDRVCDRFATEWATGRRPRAEDYVTGAAVTLRAPLLGELLRVELEARRAAGEAPTLAEFLGRFPGATTAVDAAFQATTVPAPARVAPAESEPLPEIPSYEILGVLGAGGQGVVYRAWQKELNRQVALKMVHAGAQADAQILNRFRVEAEAVARLQHPNIIQIHHVGQHAGSPYLVLELVEGLSLAKRIAGTPQPAPWTAELVEAVARAIHKAHQQGVVHRDLKPANILLTAEGQPKITDFGLARLIVGGEMRTRSGEPFGTPGYMAPEQAEGRHQATGAATDVYALGAILYELLTGRPPFKAESHLETLRQVVCDEPVAPSRLRPKLPRDLETICLKCLRKEPAQRYGSALALAEDLRRSRDGRPILARRSGSFERAWRWCRRNPALAAASIAVALLTTILAIGSTVAAWRLREQNQELRFEKRLTEANLRRAEHAEHKTQLALGQSLLSEGAALQRTGLIGQRFDSLDRLGNAAKELVADPEGRNRVPQIRNQAIAAMGLTDLRMHIQHDGGDVFSFSVDPALLRFAVVERSGDVVVRRLEDNRELARLPGPDRRDFWCSYSLFSPDGALLVAAYGLRGGGKLLRIWHLGRRELLGSVPSQAREVLHPDGRRVLFGALEGGIAVWDRAERRVVRRLPLDFTPNYLSLDPEGRRLAVNKPDRAAPRVAILELETGSVLANWDSQVGNGAMAWSADGKLLAVGNHVSDPRVYVWNVRRGALESILQGHTGEIIGAQFAHIGYLLATASWDSSGRSSV